MSVYFIRQGQDGPVKIGFATNARYRLSGLQTGHSEELSIIRLLEGSKDDEARLHRRFQHCRLGGEWFEFDDAMLTEDFGLGALDAPVIQSRSTDRRCRSFWNPEEVLHHELLKAVGGRAALAKRLHVAPWDLIQFGTAVRLRKRYWSALIVMLHEVGRHDITLDVLAALRADEAAKYKAWKLRRKQELKRIDDMATVRGRSEEEAIWFAENDPATAWWPISPVPQPMPGTET